MRRKKKYKSETAKEICMDLRDTIICKLQKQIYDWQYAMVYFTEEGVPTPKGVSQFIMRNFTRDEEQIRRLVKELDKIKTK
jgi:hypothetical protein